MQSAYLDASALVKLLLIERESRELARELGPVETVYTSELALVEVGRAIRRVAGDERGYEKSERLLAGCIQIELDDVIKRRAARSASMLATLDAVHLESALSVPDLIDIFVTYDRQLATAARDAGLTVVSPGLDA